MNKLVGKLAGPALILAGAWLIYTGYTMSEGAVSQITEAFRGRPSDEVTNYYFGGAVAVVIGLCLSGFGFGGKRDS
jgi:hypothetical protein